VCSCFTKSLDPAKNIFIVPLLYAIWIIISLRKAVRYKYINGFSSYASKEEISVLFISLTPWVGLPIIDYFNLGQATEASVTNTGFLLLLAFQLKRNVDKMRTEHQKLIDSEKKLLTWNTNLRTEVEKRTKELEKINEQKTNTFVNLAHETKTPLTLINNYLDEYIVKKGTSEEINIIKKNIDKISTDIVNFFDLEKFNKGLDVYNHDLVTNFSDLLNDNLILFKEFSILK
jgi:signal transduction histidine kinase